VPALFAATIFVSATLLFMVQPMLGKRILPLMGGTPAAWNTCMVFFQSLLLLGYLYTHAVTNKLEPRKQTRVHLTVLGVALAWLLGMSLLAPDGSPVAVFRSLAPAGGAYPVVGMLGLLGVAIGLPFLVVSTSAPLLQKWFTYTGHESAKDPYFLYAASNAGSLISLLGYPLIIEPRLTRLEQGWLWAGGFALLLVLVGFCARAANHPLRPPPARGKQVVADTGPAPTWLDRVRWVGYAFVPSSLMLGVTFHLTTDIASVPLLWVIPLALYLLTFIVAFSKLPGWFRPVIGNLSPVLTLMLVFVLTSGAMSSHNSLAFYALTIHLVVYFATALLMHSELALARPNPKYLTEYFLWISVGGVLGGIFNAILAPVLFPSDYEYAIALAVGCMLVPVLDAQPETMALFRRRMILALDFLVPLALAGLVAGLFAVSDEPRFGAAVGWCGDNLNGLLARLGVGYAVSTKTLVLIPLYALPCMLAFVFIDRPLRFGLCVAAVFAATFAQSDVGEKVEHTVRSTFGIMKIEKYDEGYPAFEFGDPSEVVADGQERTTYRYWHQQPFRKLLHGTTLHGVQADGTWTLPLLDDVQQLTATDPWAVLALRGAQASFDFRQEPLTYYHRTGPVGEIVRRFRAIDPNGPIGMVGLGTGSIAAYAQPGQSLTFYEIDRHVVDLMEGGQYFSYLQDARNRGAVVKIVLGDARLRLETATDKYGLLLIDAFSSDSIPVHLLTIEAIELYKTRLKEHGLLALHISNRYIDLEPVVARLAESSGLKCRVFSDNRKDFSGKTESSWVLLARTEADLGDAVTGYDGDTRFGAVGGTVAWFLFDNPPASGHRFAWRPLTLDPAVKPWTDDFADVMQVITMPEIIWLRRKLGLDLLESQKAKPPGE
jgi:hypothetical protein